MGKFGGHKSDIVSTGKDTVTPADREAALGKTEVITQAGVDLPSETIAQETPAAASGGAAQAALASGMLGSSFPLAQDGNVDAPPPAGMPILPFEQQEAAQLERETIVRPGTDMFGQTLLSVGKRDDNAVGQYMKIFDTVSQATDPDAPEITFKGESVSPYKAFGISTKVPGGDFSKIGKVADIIRNPEKLNMSQDPTNPNSKVQPELNHAITLAMIDVVHAIQPAPKENITDFDNESETQEVIDEENVVSDNSNSVAARIGQTIDMLAAPAQGTDPQGRTQNFGFKGRLTPEDQQVLGTAVAGAMLDMGILEEVKTVQGGKTTVSYRTKPSAATKIAVTEPVINKVLNRKRPVSLVPLPGGRYIGESAYLQREVTRVPITGRARRDIRASTMLSGAVEAMSTAPSMVISLNLGIATAMMQDTQRVGGNHPLASIFKMDADYLQDQIESAYDRLDGQNMSDAQKEAEARFEGERIQQLEIANRVKTLQEATNYSNKLFYYPHTVIGNSSRLMVASHELNYQASRLARYVVGNPKPALVDMSNPNSRVHKNFKILVMRNLSENGGKVAPEFLAAEFDIPENYNMYTRMGNEILQAQQTGDFTQLSQDTLDKILHDVDEAFFVIDSLTNFALYDAARKKQAQLGPNDPPVQMKSFIRAEFDGIQNGAIIQAYQLGLADVMGRGGLIYQDPSNILPDGDVRDHVTSFVTKDFVDGIFSDPGDSELWHKALTDLIQKDKKAFIKYPIMTTIYGKGSGGHRDSAEKMWKQLRDTDSVGQFNSQEDFINEMRKIYDVLLQTSIGNMLQHAVINKITTRMYIAFNRVPLVKGPNGYTVQSGTRGLIETGEQVRLTRPSGKQSTITMRESVPSVTAVGKNDYDKYNVGQQTINQSAVNGTQNIDAAVMQDGIVNSKGILGDDFWMQQVYDAVILDANNLDVILPEVNKSFKKINEEYEMVEAEYEALQSLAQEVRNEVQKRAKEGTPFDVGTEGEFAGITHMYADLFGYYKKFTGEDPKERSAQARKFFAQTIGRSHNDVFQWAGDLDPDRKGYVPRQGTLQITPQQYDQLYKFLAKELEIKDRWSRFRAEVKRDRAKAHPLVDVSMQYA